MNHVNVDNVGSWSDSDSRVPFTPYTERMSFVNDSRMAIKVATRRGMKFILQPYFNVNTDLRQLKVRVQINISNELQQQFLSMLNTETNIEHRAVIEKARAVWTVSGRAQPVPLRVEYIISEQLIQRNNGSIYIKDLDLAFTTNLNDPNFCHPHSVQAGLINVQHSVGTIEGPEHQYVFSVCIVDNADIIGPRWIRDAYGVTKICPVKSEKPDGFYVCHTSSATSGLEQSTQSLVYHESESSLNGLVLYKSYHEAQNADNALKAQLEANELRAKLTISDNNLEKLRSERELATTQQAILTQRLEMERDKLKHDLDSLQYEKTQSNLKHERELDKHVREIDRMTRDAQVSREAHEHAVEKLRLERDNARQSNVYDAQAQTRRSFVEILKMIGTVMSGLFSAALFILKIRGGKI